MSSKGTSNIGAKGKGDGKGKTRLTGIPKAEFWTRAFRKSDGDARTMMVTTKNRRIGANGRFLNSSEMSRFRRIAKRLEDRLVAKASKDAEDDVAKNATMDDSTAHTSDDPLDSTAHTSDDPNANIWTEQECLEWEQWNQWQTWDTSTSSSSSSTAEVVNPFLPKHNPFTPMN